MRAAGSFEVKLKPMPMHDETIAGMGRLSIDKMYFGDLKGTGKGEMLSAIGDVQSSAVYVAIECVTAALHGRSGSFAIHHRGVMTRGNPQLEISVVPDSGTGELTGISGTMTIDIRGRDHFYTFDYELPSSGVPT